MEENLETKIGKTSLLTKIRQSLTIPLVSGLLLGTLSLSVGSCQSYFDEKNIVAPIEHYDIEEITEDTYSTIRTFCYHDLDGDNFSGKNACKNNAGKEVEIEIFEDGTYAPECPPGCVAPIKFDCNDNDEQIFQGNPEICDNKDNNCNGEVDEELEIECYSDCDIGKVVCIEGEWSDCNAEIDCCNPGDIKDEIPCPYTPHVFAFVIDNSSSMDSSDPTNLRYTGLYIFLDQKHEDDKAVVIPFASEAMVVGDITSDKEELTEYIDEAKTISLGGGTDIGAALYVAIDKIESENEKKMILLLTDGGSSYNANLISNKAESSDTSIDALGLGSATNQEILMQTVTSDGGYYPINSAEEIAQVYNQVLMKNKYMAWTECKENGQWEEMYGVCK